MPAPRTFDRERAARLILEALQLGISPIEALVTMDDLTPNQASYQYRTVRDDGFLGIYPHYPTRVNQRRGSNQAVAYVACVYCHAPYPCKAGFPQGRPMKPVKIKQIRRRNKR